MSLDIWLWSELYLFFVTAYKAHEWLLTMLHETSNKTLKIQRTDSMGANKPHLAIYQLP